MTTSPAFVCAALGATASPFVARSPVVCRPSALPRVHVRNRRTLPPTCTFGGPGGGSDPGRNNAPGNGSEIATAIAELVLRAGKFLQSTNGQLVLWVGLVWLVLTGRVGVIFDSFLFLFVFISVVPVLGFLAFRWWISRQVVQGLCPNCGSNVTGLRDKTFQCMNCGQLIKGDKNGTFVWASEPSKATIDIDARSVDK